MDNDLQARFRQGDRRALARLLTLAAHGEPVKLEGPAPEKNSRVVAFTGSAGVGKSTLVGKVIELLRGQGQRVAVLACDPQSPVSGGALLGDRFRMPSQPDDGVFIRSLAAAGGRGAIAEHLPTLIDLLERFGFETILLETVGAGQGDTTVHELADVVVLLLQPEAGDELQWEKAGVLEVADIVVVQKADLPGAEATEAQVKNILGLSKEPVTVLRVSAKSGAGIEALWQAIATRPLRRAMAQQDGEELLNAAREILAIRFRTAEAGGSEDLKRIKDAYQQGQLSRAEAAAAVLRALDLGERRT